MVAHTWQRFEDAKCIDEIILVVRKGKQKKFEELAAIFNFRKPFRMVSGGEERQDSVWNGLEALSPDTEIVAIQDAARPCTGEELIATTIQSANETGAAVAAQPVTDTIKESADGTLIQRTLDRSSSGPCRRRRRFAWRSSAGRWRRRAVAGLIFTDDTAACELIGQPVWLVSSAMPNPEGDGAGRPAVRGNVVEIEI